MPKKKPRKWVWIIMTAALVLGGGAATTVAFINQATQAAEHKAALTKHADAITAYEAAWTEFDRQNTDTRDDQGQLSMTSLDNAEEVSEAFLSAIAAADELEHQDFDKADPGATNENLGSDTQRIETATGEVQAVTKHLADASALFLDSHRNTVMKSLTNEIENAQQALDASQDTGDADLVAQLEQAISDARSLADDPKAHPTDIRNTMEDLYTLAGKVKDSAGPSPDSIAGTWVIPQGGGVLYELTSTTFVTKALVGNRTESHGISFMSEPSEAGVDPSITERNSGCLFYQVLGTSLPSKNILAYCPPGVGWGGVDHSDVERVVWYQPGHATLLIRGN